MYTSIVWLVLDVYTSIVWLVLDVFTSTLLSRSTTEFSYGSTEQPEEESDDNHPDRDTGGNFNDWTLPEEAAGSHKQQSEE